jgi:hypothetical protein
MCSYESFYGRQDIEDDDVYAKRVVKDDLKTGTSILKAKSILNILFSAYPSSLSPSSHHIKHSPTSESARTRRAKTSPTKNQSSSIEKRTNNKNCSLGYIEGTFPTTNLESNIAYHTQQATPLLSPHHQSSSKRGGQLQPSSPCSSRGSEGMMLPVQNSCCKEATS